MAEHPKKAKKSFRHPLKLPLFEEGLRWGAVFDFDGTLSEISTEKDRVFMLPEAQKALTQLKERLRVLIVTGRTCESIMSIAKIDGIEIAGLHGMMKCHPRREMLVDTIWIEKTRQAVEMIKNHIGRISLSGLEVEDKELTVAVHYRKCVELEGDERKEEEFLAGMESIAAQIGLKHMRGRKVIELLPETEINKGYAVIKWAEQNDIKHILYAGDDTTDVKAFSKLREAVSAGILESAFLIAVGSEESPEGLIELSDCQVASPNELSELVLSLMEK